MDLFVSRVIVGVMQPLCFRLLVAALIYLTPYAFRFGAGINSRRGFSTKAMEVGDLSEHSRSFEKPQKPIERAINPESGAYDFNMWTKAFMTQREEFDYVLDASEVEGTLPLTGTLFRNMPALFERNGVDYGHYLDGDGYVIKLSIDVAKGEVRFQSKFVKTTEFVEEEEQGKITTRSTFRTQRRANDISVGLTGIDFNNALDLKLKNLANTNVMYWGGKLLTLFEAGVPYSLNPVTLDTYGKENLGLEEILNGALPVMVPKLKEKLPFIHNTLFGQHCTAHPKIADGHMILWTWCAGSELEGLLSTGPLDSKPLVHFREFDEMLQPIVRSSPLGEDRAEENGLRRDLESSISDERTVGIVLMNTTVVPHDFSLTQNHYVIVENRLAGDTLPYILGTKCPAECVNLLPQEEMLLHLVPRLQSESREGELAKRWVVPLSSGFTIHSVGAWEDLETGHVELLTSAWSCEDVAKGNAKGGLLGNWEGRAPNFDDIPITLLYHTVIDTATGVCLRHAPVEGMEETIIEHPHINPQYEGKKARYVFMSVGSQTGVSSPPLGYLKLDHETGERQVWYAPEHTYCEEVVVVPKDGAMRDEDDVYLLTMMFDAVKDKSSLGIFDGKDIVKGPVARIWLRHQLPHSLHGCFTKEIF